MAWLCPWLATRWRCPLGKQKDFFWSFPDLASYKTPRAPLVSPSITTTYHQPLSMDVCPSPVGPRFCSPLQPSFFTLKHPPSQVTDLFFTLDWHLLGDQFVPVYPGL